MSLSFSNFFHFCVFFHKHIPDRGEGGGGGGVEEYDVLLTRWNRKIVERVPKSLIGVNHKESPSREVKTKMALHSKVQA